MNSITRRALAGAVSGVVAGGLALGMTPPVAAAPHAVHAKAGHAAKASAHSKAAQARLDRADRKVALAKRQLSQEATRKDAYLGRMLGRVKYLGLEAGVRDAVRLTIEADRAALVTFKETVTTAAAADLPGLAADLRKVRPEVYNSVLAQLKEAAILKAAATELVVPEAIDLLGTLETTVSAYTARTTHAQLQVSREWLATAAALIEAAAVPAEEPADAPADEPVVEPVADAPTT